MSWPRRLVAFDPLTGKELWSCDGLGALVYGSPVFDGSTIVSMSGFGGPALAAQVGGNRLWHHPRAKQRIGSGVIHDGHLYIHTDPGVAECFELATGNLVWEEPLKRQKNWSSVLLAGGNCYTITQAGDCFVFKAAPRFELVAVNPLGEPSNSSIVPSDGSLFIRTHKALWRIGR